MQHCKNLGLEINILRDKKSLVVLGIGNHLFVKVPRPEDSEVTFSVFESSCDLAVTIGTSLTTQR